MKLSLEISVSLDIAGNASINADNETSALFALAAGALAQSEVISADGDWSIRRKLKIAVKHLDTDHLKPFETLDSRVN